MSVVVPVFNEREVLAELHRRIGAALTGLEFELVLVDDGSDDGSAERLEALAAADPRTRVITLSRNFGHQAAITAGLDHARGDVIVMIDADLQDPPELIPTMLDHWRHGSDVVYAVRTERAGRDAGEAGHGALVLPPVLAPGADRPDPERRRLPAPRPARARGAQLDARAQPLPARDDGLGRVHPDRGPLRARRRATPGETKYTPRRMFRFSLDAISSFSHVPLQVATALGFAVSAIAFLGIPVAIGLKLAGSTSPGSRPCCSPCCCSAGSS